MRAFVYLRQSLDRSGDGAAVERQRIDCEKLCAERGWSIARTYVDNDTSASSKKPRPQYQAMLSALRDGGVEIVVAWHIDRLTRKLTELEELIELSQRTGARIATVTGDIDLTTDAGRLVGRILASVARGEVERKGARQRRAQQQAAAEGRPAGGRRAFGYANDGITVIEDEAVLVREGFQRILEGGTLKGIAKDWNERGATTPLGYAWEHSNVRYVMRNPRYCGRRRYKGEVVGDAVWPAIVDGDTFDAVHAILSMPQRRTTTVPLVRLYLLPGLARCYCGATVLTGRTQHNKRTYRCKRQKGHMSRAADPIDAFVEEVVIERLSRPDAGELLSDPVRADLGVYRERSDAIRGRLDDLATALADGLLSLDAVRRASAGLQKELEAAEAQIAMLSQADVLGPVVGASDVRAAWGAVELDTKRAIIDLLMTVVILKPLMGRHAFDPETVRVEWKGVD